MFLFCATDLPIILRAGLPSDLAPAEGAEVGVALLIPDFSVIAEL